MGERERFWWVGEAKGIPTVIIGSPKILWIVGLWEFAGAGALFTGCFSISIRFFFCLLLVFLPPVVGGHVLSRGIAWSSLCRRRYCARRISCYRWLFRWSESSWKIFCLPLLSALGSPDWSSGRVVSAVAVFGGLFSSLLNFMLPPGSWCSFGGQFGLFGLSTCFLPFPAGLCGAAVWGILPLSFSAVSHVCLLEDRRKFLEFFRGERGGFLLGLLNLVEGLSSGLAANISDGWQLRWFVSIIPRGTLGWWELYEIAMMAIAMMAKVVWGSNSNWGKLSKGGLLWSHIIKTLADRGLLSFSTVTNLMVGLASLRSWYSLLLMGTRRPPQITSLVRLTSVQERGGRGGIWVLLVLFEVAWVVTKSSLKGFEV